MSQKAAFLDLIFFFFLVKTRARGIFLRSWEENNIGKYIYIYRKTRIGHLKFLVWLHICFEAWKQ